MIPDIAIGALGAAIIGALISFVGLIVAKESKVSEFRQAWIDALRGELSTFLSNVNAVVDAQHLTFKTSNERFETLQPYFSKLNESYYLVALRLNSNEEPAKKLKACMIDISGMAKGEAINLSTFDAARVEFINSSNRLLKNEWSRVKQGEPVFQATKWVAAGAVFLLIAAASFIAINGNGNRNSVLPSETSAVSKQAPVTPASAKASESTRPPQTKLLKPPS